MTIEELYKLAKANHAEKKELVFQYDCEDDWYSYESYVDTSNVSFDSHEDAVTIVFSNEEEE